MHRWVFRKDIKLCKALKIMSVNRRDCWNGGETEKGFWREGRIWLESRSVSIPETAWSNRELSQTKHFWTSVWHREAELLPRPDLTAHSQCTDPEHSVSSSATTFFCVCRTMLPNRGKATWDSSQQVVQCVPVLTSRSEETLLHYFCSFRIYRIMTVSGSTLLLQRSWTVESGLESSHIHIVEVQSKAFWVLRKELPFPLRVKWPHSQIQINM